MARDVMLVFHGSIALVTPLTEPATIWVRQHLEHEESSTGVAPLLSSLATWARSSPTWLMTVW